MLIESFPLEERLHLEEGLPGGHGALLDLEPSRLLKLMLSALL